MSTIEARYLDGSSVKVNHAESVGDIMFYFAKTQNKFASDVVVTCAYTGENLCDSPSQTPPPVVQVAVKSDTKQTVEDLLLTLRLHSKRKDEATCALAYIRLRREYKRREMDAFEGTFAFDGRTSLYRRILEDVLQEGARGNEEIEGIILRTLISVGVNANYFLQKAAGDGDEGRVRRLLTEGISIECPDDSEDIHVCSVPALSAAAWQGRENIVGILIAHKADVNRDAHVHEMPSIPVCQKPQIVGSPLTLACHNGHIDIVKMLIDHKADVDQNSFSTWPLHAACTQRRIDVVRILLSCDADVNYALPPFKYDMPIMLAAKHGDADLVQLLVCHKAKVQCFDNDYNTPVSTAISLHDNSSDANIGGKIEVLQLLLASKASANIGSTRLRKTPLILAMENEKMKDAIKILLDHKADVNADCFGIYPLRIAAQNGDADTVKLLLSHKADLNLKHVLATAIAVASEGNHKAVLEILEPFNTNNIQETGTSDAPKTSIKDILEDINRQRRASALKNGERISGRLPEGDATYEEIYEEIEEYIFLTLEYKLCNDNENRKARGKKPIKLGKRFLNRMKELTDDGTSDVVCSCKSRRKGN